MLCKATINNIQKERLGLSFVWKTYLSAAQYSKESNRNIGNEILKSLLMTQLLHGINLSLSTAVVLENKMLKI